MSDVVERLRTDMDSARAQFHYTHEMRLLMAEAADENDHLRAQLAKLAEAARDVLIVLDTGERSGTGSCLGQLRAVLDEIEKEKP